jgi:hypothetical protein
VIVPFAVVVENAVRVLVVLEEVVVPVVAPVSAVVSPAGIVMKEVERLVEAVR